MLNIVIAITITVIYHGTNIAPFPIGANEHSIRVIARQIINPEPCKPKPLENTHNDIPIIASAGASVDMYNTA